MTHDSCDDFDDAICFTTVRLSHFYTRFLALLPDVDVVYDMYIHIQRYFYYQCKVDNAFAIIFAKTTQQNVKHHIITILS